MKRVAWFAVPLTAVIIAALLVFNLRTKERVLTFDGLGPVRLGMTLAEAETALGAKLAPIDLNNHIDREDCWITDRADDADPSVSYMISYGKVVRIDIRHAGEQYVIPSVVTERRVGLTSSVDEVKKAYGSELAVDFHIQGNHGDYGFLYMTVLTQDKKYGHFFETWENRMTSFGSSTVDALYQQEGCF